MQTPEPYPGCEVLVADFSGYPYYERHGHT